MALSTADQIQEMYIAYYGRPADPAGLEYWTQQAEAAGGFNPCILAFGSAPEATDLHAGMTTEEMVNSLYNQLFGRDAEAAGLAYWTELIDNGTVPLVNAAWAMINGAQGTDADAVANKLAAANDFTTALDTDAEIAAYSGNTAAATARTWLATVDETADSLTAAEGTMDATINDIMYPSIPGETFTLTTATDTVIGTSGDDTITGISTTFNVADVIIDQSTTDNDTLNVTLTVASAAARVSGIENVNFDWNAFGTATIDAANITDATITVTSSKLGYLGNTQFNNVGENTVVAGEGAVGAMDVNGGTEVVVDAGAAATVTVDGTGVAADDLSATVTAGADTTTIAVGNANAFETVTVTGGAATTAITVNGTAGTDDVANITVSEDVTLAVATAIVETLNITAADGNEVTLAGGALLDEATVTSTGAVTLAAAGADLTGHTLTNATAGLTLAFTSDGGADDLSDVEFDLIDFQNALAADVTVSSGANMNADVNLAANEIFTGTGTADTATLNLSVDQTAIDVVDGTNDIETLTITTTLDADDADETLTIGSLTVVDTILTGADDVTLTLFDAESIDASALTGAFTATQNTKAAVSVVGSATADNAVTFTADTFDIEYTGGEGDDTIVMAQTTGDSTVLLGNGANTYTNTTLTDGTAVVLGGTGVDTITVTATDSGANTANVVIQSGGGADDVTLSLAGANETADVDLGDGDDTLTIGNATSAGDVLAVEGGAGTDTIDLNGKNISSGSITLSGIEVIHDSTGAGAVDASLLDGETFTIKGNGNIATLLDVTTATAGEYDFSGLVLDQTLTAGIGGLNITGNAANDTIVATDGNDTITGGTGTNTITGGAGVDTMTSGGTDTFVFAASDSGITAATLDEIIAFTTGADKLQLGTAGSVTNFVDLDGDDDLGTATVFADALIAAENEITTTVKYALVSDGATAAESWLFIDNTGDGNVDMAITLTGIAVGGLVATDIIA